MNKQLDSKFRAWLEKLSNDWNLPIELTASEVGLEEVQNRIRNYPKVSSALNSLPLDIQQFAIAVRKCWVMGGRYDGMHFNEFVRSGDRAVASIQEFIRNLPQDDRDTTDRINTFIQSAVNLGFTRKANAADRSGAAQLASVILTSLYPSRFVDFRRIRWKKFAVEFKYQQPSSTASYGEWIIWAGKFATEISQTQTYQEFWPQADPQLSSPLWVISGISWPGLSPKRSPLEPLDPDAMSFPEGNEFRREHLIRERNRSLVAKVKAIGLRQDPKLRCQVCGFSFLETYGEHGRGFVEAHHKQPFSGRTTKRSTRIEDMALVCANCHRMIHRRDKTLTLEELKALLQNKGTDAD